MQPYVIRQGDHIGRLAYELGFDADAVWNDPANDDLRQIRTDPNILWPTDVLYVPTPAEPESQDLVVGDTNSFVADPPTMDLRLMFSDPGLASKPVTIAELPDLTGLTIAGDGTLSLTVPVTLDAVTVVFDDETSFSCQVAFLDPINTLSGVAGRLQNLGFLSPRADPGAIAIDVVRSALGVFLASYATDDDGTSASADGTDDPDADQDYDLMLRDDGTLDDAAAKVLLRVHGS